MKRALWAVVLLPLSSCRGCSDDPEAVRALAPVADFERDEDGRIVGVVSTGGSRRFRDTHIAHLHRLPHLRTLVIAEEPITDEGLRHLAECPRLEEVTIGLCGITDAGLEHLKKIRRLRAVRVGLTNVTDGGIQGLREALPRVEVNGLRPLGSK